jgi:hypothetical protein
MSLPRFTRMNTNAGRNEELTNRAAKRFTFGTSLLCVSTAGREAGSAEPALAFWEKESAERPFGPQPGQASPTLGAKNPAGRNHIKLTCSTGPKSQF